MKVIRILVCFSCVAAMRAVDGSSRDDHRIVVTAWARSDVTKPENRVFVFGGAAHRTIDELIATIRQRYEKHPSRDSVRIVIHGSDVVPSPRVTPEERERIRVACEKIGVPFAFIPAV